MAGSMPGATALTRTPQSACWTAAMRVIAAIAAFEAP
ncbi:hypothetical protein SAMN05443637_125110 [Pseudonocardia thermophila]|jgi:hypothetical protein|uniref:Uncharacterized protein n=1 Tax=Pseudonocardia thermophila TaxID=1848 RepID=A0A1M7A187_PSETH|nr:hypothetical protein SAMN05443637_125110 [Pseudonocardia thermophila]